MTQPPDIRLRLTPERVDIPQMGGVNVSTPLIQYTFLQQAEWAGRIFYRVRENQTGRELYLIQQPAGEPFLAPDLPGLPPVRPVAPDGAFKRWTGPIANGDSLATLRARKMLPAYEMRQALGAVMDALSILSTLSPPLVPGSLDPEHIRRGDNGDWVLDYLALAFHRDARLPSGTPPGINAFGRLLYWLVTGESLRHGTTQVPVRADMPPLLYFTLMRCLTQAYAAQSELERELELLWKDDGFLLLIRDLGGISGETPAHSTGPSPDVPGLVRAANNVRATARVTAPDAELVVRDHVDRSMLMAGPVANAPRQPTAWTPVTSAPAHTLKTSFRLRWRVPRLVPWQVGATVAVVLLTGVLWLWPRSQPASRPEVAALPLDTQPSKVEQQVSETVVAGEAKHEEDAPTLAAREAEQKLLAETASQRRFTAETPVSETAKRTAPPAPFRPASPPPAFPAITPGSHQDRDRAAGGSPTWISLDKHWVGYTYIFYASSGRFISLDAFNALFGRNFTYAENGGGTYVLREGAYWFVTRDVTFPGSRLWLNLTPDLQRRLGVSLQRLDDWGMHFSTQ